jgi:aspartate aminotransferase
MSAEQLRAAITPRTRLVFLNSPNNPTGAAYSRAELQAIGDVLLQHPRIVICTDDMYEHIYWAHEPFASFAAVCPELYDRTVTVNGVSKAYAMTGWRIGYCGGPAELINAMSIVQSQSTSNPSSIAQYASVAALNGDQSCVREMNKHYQQRHDFLVAGLNDLPGITCLAGAGTFYSFANVGKAIQTLGLGDDQAFAEHLLNTTGVAVVPGSAFGAPGHMRLSFACSMQTLETALKRIAQALTSH